MPKLLDIPPFIRSGEYEVDCDIRYLEEWLKGYPEADLDPDFQRDHVWTPEQETRYVEFLLRGGRTARTLYWNHPAHFPLAQRHGDLPARLVLVDGKQRLKAVRGFMSGRVPVFGHFFEEWEDTDRALRIHIARLTMNINYLQTRRELLQWYLDLNCGGTVHTTEELDKVRRMIEETS